MYWLRGLSGGYLDNAIPREERETFQKPVPGIMKLVEKIIQEKAQ